MIITIQLQHDAYVHPVDSRAVSDTLNPQYRVLTH